MENTENTKNSAHQVIVFRLEGFEPHPDADKLKLIKIPNTSYVYCANYEDWKDKVGNLVAWVPPDNMVDPLFPGFSFLLNETRYNEHCEADKKGRYVRVKAKRLRGVVSYGILVDAPPNSNVGDDVASQLNVIHYNEPIHGESSKKGVYLGGQDAPQPEGVYYKYDVEAFLKYAERCYVPGETVYLDEKIHGANARYVYMNGEFHCASRTAFKREYPDKPILDTERILTEFGQEKLDELNKRLEFWRPKQCQWWKALREDENLQKFLKDNPGHAVYGELTGVSSFKYGLLNGAIKIYVFDILKDGVWLNHDQARELAPNLNWVPQVAKIPFDFNEIVRYAEGNSLVPGAKHIREGVVVSLPEERYNSHGRIKLKVINPEYLIRK